VCANTFARCLHNPADSAIGRKVYPIDLPSSLDIAEGVELNKTVDEEEEGESARESDKGED
jgi:hypothetical protein